MASWHNQFHHARTPQLAIMASCIQNKQKAKENAELCLHEWRQ
jgi:hypothetical protein